MVLVEVGRLGFGYGRPAGWGRLVGAGPLLPPPEERLERLVPGGGECFSQIAAKVRAYAQTLVITRLLDVVHDPLAQISRLQRIHPRAW